MNRVIGKGLVLAILALTPGLVPAQCMGSSTTGHQHGSDAPTRSERKSEKAANDLLSDESGRQVLMNAILADSRFMQDLIARLAGVPEWRALAADRIGLAPNGRPGGVVLGTVPEAGPAAGTQDSAIYTCPMHPEVRSRQPGRCPKCGMELQRSR